MGPYKSILKPILFKQDPETVHNRFIRMGKLLGKFSITRGIVSLFCKYENPRLNVKIENVFFPNPVGLSAGFDKNAEITDIIGSVGFGFIEVGSITGEPCVGNPKPRLWRLPEDKGLAVYYGLANEGAEAISSKLKIKKLRITTGISIAKTNDPNIKGDESVNDYFKAYSLLKDIGDYVTINISCPNTGDGCSFQESDLLEKLLKKIDKPSKPCFLKISPDLPKSKVDKIISLVLKYKLTGLVISNLKHNHDGLKTPKEILNKTKGGISGPITKKLSDDLISYVYEKTKGNLIIIGVGGIFSAEDAYQKIKNGATLVQLITGMIYEGPTLIKKINKDLIKLLDRDGFNNIQEAVGVNNK